MLEKMFFKTMFEKFFTRKCKFVEQITPTLPPRLPEVKECVLCNSIPGGICDVEPYTITDVIPCNYSCVTQKVLLNLSK